MKPEGYSPKRKLKPEQAAAAHTLDRHLSVTAGPGSGKTTVLVERYLEILRTQSVSVDNIVAITFTNRASNEMRERVRGEIDSLLRATGGDERKKWLRHKRALEGAVITTIHGFCSRLLHEFPVEANIDPQFVLLDEHQAAMMLEAIVDETLGDAIHRENEKIIQLAQGVGGRGMLSAAFADLYRKYRGEGLSLNDIRERTQANHATIDQYQSLLGELDTRMRELLAAPARTADARQRQLRVSEEWPALRAILARPPSDQNVARYCQAIEDFYEARPRKGSNPIVPAVDELLWGIDSKPADRLSGKLPGVGFDLLAQEFADAVLKLAYEIERRLDEEKQRLSVLDFDDLQLRTLKLLDEHPEALNRISERYRFFLVDEFQDTNGLQRDLTTKLALARGANLFVVGDRKQSIYGFRGADVDVFREITASIESAGGARQPLHLNFRSPKLLIDSLNFLFAKIFQPPAEVPGDQLDQLGFVEHEPSIAEREGDREAPLVEMLVSVLPDGRRGPSDSEESDEQGTDRHDSRDARERDAAQLVERIQGLVSGTDPQFRHGDIAILFRALTGSGTYESALRRAGIPYLTVQGRGFYQREEITDLIQLLRFLDNTTDEIALAAVLRSPLCGISDNALLALRSAPRVGEQIEEGRLHRRGLWRAVRQHREIQFIEDEEHEELDRVADFLDAMIQRRNRHPIADLLRFAVRSTQFTAVIAANFDGAQRIANVEKLFRLAEAFEKSGQLIRDFVHYVEEFEVVGGRESEGQMDKNANVVRLMTIHQAKGLEFPVVIIPELHRYQSQRDASVYVLDRHKGLTVAVPDGRGQTVHGALFNEMRRRASWRERFESMRLLYVAATRAEERLILSAAVTRRELKSLKETTREQWLAWLWQALELDEFAPGGLLRFGEDVMVELRVDREPRASDLVAKVQTSAHESSIDPSRPLTEIFPLLQPIEVERGRSLRRFSVTQLINFQRCRRQYYFDRLLRTPGTEELSVWNDAEAPEPPANLTATLKGAVIHRFCETFQPGDDAEACLRESFHHVKAQREAELAGRVFEVVTDVAMVDLMPLAQNYLDSEVFQRVNAARKTSAEIVDANIRSPQSSPGLWSELRFRVRRPLGILTGTIDKLLITPSANDEGVDVEIIDFKTNRFFADKKAKTAKSQIVSAAAGSAPNSADVKSGPAQGFFNFEAREETTIAIASDPSSIELKVEKTARDYQLQMQAYALALRELLPASVKIASLRATLHFLDPRIEIAVPSEFLKSDVSPNAIDDAMLTIAALDGQLEVELFPPTPATHCRMCNFLDLCPAGQEHLGTPAAVRR